MIRTRSGALAIAALVTALLLSLTLGQSVTSASASTGDGSHQSTHQITAYAFLKIRTADGKLIYKHFYPADTAGKAMHLSRRASSAMRVASRSASGNGGSSSASGTATAGVGQVDSSVLGKDLWKFVSRVNWTWNRSKMLVTKNTDTYNPYNGDLDPFWDWNGLIGQSHHYFDWNSTNVFQQSGYHSMYQGKYTGPNAIGITHEYPRNELDVHSNGTWYWAWSCCGAP